MADDAMQPGPPGNHERPAPDAIRPGAPGHAGDTVPLARPPSVRRPPTQTSPSVPPPPQETKDSFRETIETIVFVVVLVLMLKTFLAEAFVIPTGSMATTLLGYHKDINCRQCGFEFPVNVSSEAEPRDPRNPVNVLTVDCPNCYFRNEIPR